MKTINMVASSCLIVGVIRFAVLLWVFCKGNDIVNINTGVASIGIIYSVSLVVGGIGVLYKKKIAHYILLTIFTAQIGVGIARFLLKSNMLARNVDTSLLAMLQYMIIFVFIYIIIKDLKYK